MFFLRTQPNTSSTSKAQSLRARRLSVHHHHPGWNRSQHPATGTLDLINALTTPTLSVWVKWKIWGWKQPEQKRSKWAKNGCLEELFSHGDFPAAAAAAVFKLKERPGSGMWGYVPSLPERIVSTEKISTTEIRVIIFQLKWGSAAANLSASERSERKGERSTWWGWGFFFMSPIWARSSLLYYLTVRVYFILLLAITSSPI